MGLSLPRLLSLTSEWIWLGKHLSCLPQGRSVVDACSSNELRRSVRARPCGIWWGWPGWERRLNVKGHRSLRAQEIYEVNLIDVGVHGDSQPCVGLNSTETTNKSCSEWKMLAGRLLVRVLHVTSNLYKTMKKKWQSAEDTIEQLRITLQRRNNQVKELGGIIHELRMTTSQHQRRIELQKNQLEEQEGMLLELYVALQMRGSGPHSIVAQDLGTRLRQTPKEYWLLRKHRGNLVEVTKPIIQSVIRQSCTAGLVSSSIGVCALNCPSQDHDCTDEFFKALQATVKERPKAFTEFLEIVHDNSDSPTCQKLCQKIRNEVTPM